ncbi:MULTISPECIES: long-chain fatty acid--CoA ligase [unclassified Herbaspirillum]|uniref:AMP-dependent synthetase/ligase n=1 Tax=unclassified Herbaspirillum TaxID=2624150 RepID=UPI0011534486|nr:MULTISPECIES: AMP-binding protein [unclassified Herbaspirillum]MBB5393372.1 long-chain acyl-CoA synthetase [Herbaspirillum sp. SJZ102]TQK03880.1 long-chain acyl-CoA synthetase [Herbaspirillum sp. SJZ130]TQK08612.1 long-chain acyl-CoA synthetase [Herbaspirillum sp. SJZ106]
MVETRQETETPTFPQLLLAHAQARPQRPAFREKDLGIWQATSWQQVADEVRAFACGLAALGFRRGMSLAIIGNNCPRLYWAMSAAQVLGGMSVPLYQDAPAADMAYVLADANVDFVMAEDQEQVDKVFEIKENLPRIAHIIYDDERGMRNYHQPELLSFARVQELGRAYERAHPDFFMDQVKAGNPDDVAIILYTSGTTGKPKGVCHSHRAMIATARTLVEFDRLDEDDDILCYLPLAWIGDFLYSFAQQHVAGFCLNCPESPNTVMSDLREIGPTYYFAPPRIYENILTQVMIRIEDVGWIKRTMFHGFMRVARRVGMRILDRKPGVSLVDRLQYALGDLLVYGPLKNVLGMSRLRVAYTGGEAIGPDLFDFYRSLGINLKQLYGMTETCVTICMQPSGDVKLDSVGRPMKGVEVRIDDNGEVLVRSPGLMKEYFKRPDATAEAIDAEGYFHTGDAGFFDSDGHLKIIDRAKDVGKMASGSMFAPKYIENKLKFFPFVKEAVTFGNGRDKCMAFINIDMDAVGNWAERRNLPYSGYTDLAANPAVYELVRECVEKVNADLAADPLLADSQVHRFLILHKELDPDDEELTRTRKVRRGFIADKYAVLIEALYDGRASQYIETQVKFEDGRQGMIAADLKIAEAKTFAALGRAA